MRSGQDSRILLYGSKREVSDSQRSFDGVIPPEMYKLHHSELLKTALDYTHAVPIIDDKISWISFEKSDEKSIQPTQDIDFPEHCIECEIDNTITDQNVDNVQTLGFMDDQNTARLEKLHSSSNLTFPNADTDTVKDSEIAQLKSDIQRDDIIYIAKSTHIQEQMKLLREQMESIKIRDMMSICDFQHEEKIFKGENKYSTINKVKEGTTKNRIAFFEEL